MSLRRFCAKKVGGLAKIIKRCKNRKASRVDNIMAEKKKHFGQRTNEWPLATALKMNKFPKYGERLKLLPY